MKHESCPSLEVLRNRPFFFFNVHKQEFYETTENELFILRVKASELFWEKETSHVLSSL